MRYWIVTMIAGILLSCQSGANKLQTEKETLEALELQLLTAQDVNVNPEVAAQYLEKCQAFADAYPKDSLAPAYLFRSADVARGLREYGLAIQLAGRVWRDYPEYAKAPDAMFIQGYIYDSDLKDTLNARKYYEHFLSKYPGHPLAANVSQLVELLGQDMEGLVKQFEENAKKEK